MVLNNSILIEQILTNVPRKRMIAIQMRFAPTIPTGLLCSHARANLGSKGMVRMPVSVSMLTRLSLVHT